MGSLSRLPLSVQIGRLVEEDRAGRQFAARGIPVGYLQ